MAKVTVDTATCVGCGLCEQVCPEVFKVEGDGLAHVKGLRLAERDFARRYTLHRSNHEVVFTGFVKHKIETSRAAEISREVLRACC